MGPLDSGFLRTLDARQLELLRTLIAQQLSILETYIELARFAEAERARYAARIAALLAARRARARPRDWEIMRLARRGWTNQQIGDRVGLSAGRVSQIIRRELGSKRPQRRGAEQQQRQHRA